MCAFPNLLACRLRALCVGVCVLCDWLASIDPSCCYKNWLKCARAVCFSRRQIEEDIYRYSFVLTLKKTFIATVLFLQAIAAMTTTGDSVELRLIPEYAGKGSCSIEEWLEKVQLVCDLRSVTKIETVIPLRLGGSAFAVYQQLTKSQKGDAAAIKAALIGAFGLDKFSAYEEFASRKLRPGEPVEVYLAELRKLASSFGGVTEEAMSCFSTRNRREAGKEEVLSLQPHRPPHRLVSGKRGRGEGRCATLFPKRPINAAHPVIRAQVDGAMRSILVDTGSSCSIVFEPYCESWVREAASVTSVCGGEMKCLGVSCVKLRLKCGTEAKVWAYVSDVKPLGFDCILGMNGISSLGGLRVNSQGEVCFDRAKHDDDSPSIEPFSAAITVEQKDFRVVFNEEERAWTAEWFWRDGEAPPDLISGVGQYPMSSDVRPEFESQIEQWIEKEWLVLYDEDSLGPPRARIPMMAVIQTNKKKVRPVLDYRSLNAFLDTHTADADVCADKLRDWRRRGVSVSTLDLASAYMQIRISENLWPFQTVIFRDKLFCLTRLGFGLSVAPSIMKAVLSATLACDEEVDRASSAYVDDILVNESILSAEQVGAHLRKFGLECKPAERLVDGARVLGLKVWGDQGRLLWARENSLPDIPSSLTRRSVFSVCGRLVGHLPVCGWLRPAVAFVKRMANSKSRGWDDEIVDESLKAVLADLLQRVRQNDPAQGVWDVSGDKGTVWVDASSIATGAMVEVEGRIIEDGSWLRPGNDPAHINLSELDAVLRGINMALSWKLKTVHLNTDSTTVFHWISDALSGKARLKTKAASEMLIRRRVGTFRELVKEYDLDVTVALVASIDNRADALTRVPQKWLKLSATCGSGDLSDDQACGAGHVRTSDADRIFRIHCDTGHQGIDRSLYFVRRRMPHVSRSDVVNAIKTCQTCLSIDPAPVRWERGHLDVPDVWARLSMDITHVDGHHYLTLIDSGPSRFALWKKLRIQSSGAVAAALEIVFCERGAPKEILTDNDTAFRGTA